LQSTQLTMKTFLYLIAFILLSSCVTTSTYKKIDLNPGQYVLEVQKKSARQVSGKIYIPKDLKQLSETETALLKWTLNKSVIDKYLCDTIFEPKYRTKGSPEKDLYLVMKGYPATYTNLRPMISSDSLLLDAGKLVLFDPEKSSLTQVRINTNPTGTVTIGLMALLNAWLFYLVIMK